jgi:hypothetical protein
MKMAIPAASRRSEQRFRPAQRWRCVGDGAEATESSVLRQLVVGVGGRFQLKGGMLDVEMAG